MSKHSLEGKVVVIGGGAKNLGGLISRTFASEGARICVHYNSSSTKADAEKTVGEIEAAGGEAFGIQGDFTKVAEVVAAFDAAKKRFGGIDIAINTVGKVLKKPIVETTEADYDSMAAINSKAAYFFIQEAGRQLNDHGRICTIVTSLLAAYTGLYSVYGGRVVCDGFRCFLAVEERRIHRPRSHGRYRNSARAEFFGGRAGEVLNRRRSDDLRQRRLYDALTLGVYARKARISAPISGPTGP